MTDHKLTPAERRMAEVFMNLHHQTVVGTPPAVPQLDHARLAKWLDRPDVQHVSAPEPDFRDPPLLPCSDDIDTWDDAR